LHIVSGVSFSPSAEYVCTTSNDKSLRLWRTSNGEPVAILQGHMQFVNCCKWAPDGSAVVTGSSDKTLRAWQLRRDGDGDMSKFVWGNGTVLEFAFAHCNASMQDDHQDSEDYHRLTMKHRRHLPDMKCVLTTLLGHEGGVTGLDISRCCRYIISVSSDKSARLWDYAKSLDQKLLSTEAPGGGSRALLMTLRGHQRAVISCCFSPDSRHVATGSQDFTVRVYEVATGTLLRDIFAGECYCTSIAFSGTASDMLLVSTGGKKIKVFSLFDQTVDAALPSAGRSVASLAVRSHAGGQALCIAGGDHVMCYVPEILNYVDKAAAGRSVFSMKSVLTHRDRCSAAVGGSSRMSGTHSLPNLSSAFALDTSSSHSSAASTNRLRVKERSSCEQSRHSAMSTHESLSQPLLSSGPTDAHHHACDHIDSILPPHAQSPTPAAGPAQHVNGGDYDRRHADVVISTSILHRVPTSDDGGVATPSTTSTMTSISNANWHIPSASPAHEALGPATSSPAAALRRGVDRGDPSLIESPPTGRPVVARMLLTESDGIAAVV